MQEPEEIKLDIEEKDSEKSSPDVEMLEKELNREKGKQNYRRAFKATISVILVTAAIAVLTAVYLLPAFRIYGSSMTPTLEEGDIVIAINTHSFKNGDLVGFYYGNKLLVKRCIAGPGDIVNIDANGNVYINDKLIDEPYLNDEMKALGQTNIDLPYQVPEDRWFFMGDHRETSVDSRNTAVGAVSQEQVKGKIIFRVWPLNKFGTVN